MFSTACVVCTKDRPVELEECALRSIEAQTRPPDELVVAYAGSETSARLVAEFAARNPNVRVTCIPCEPGLTRQRNIAVDAAASDILFFLDDDIRLDPDCLASILDAFTRPGHDSVIGVSPMLMQRGAPTSVAWAHRLFLLHHVGAPRLLPSGYTVVPWNRPDTPETSLDFACGCCAYRRSLFDVERFDEFFAGYGYMEDLEFSLRARRHGAILLAPNAVAHHLEAPVDRADPRFLARMRAVNHWYVARRHLPRDLYHQLAFAWSELGNAVLYLRLGLVRRDWRAIRGWMDARRSVRRREIPEPAPLTEASPAARSRPRARI